MFTCILKAREVITAGMLWCVGDGKSIKIYADRWLPSTSPSKIISPQVDMVGEWTVSQLLDSSTGGWNHHLVESLFLPFEAQ